MVFILNELIFMLMRNSQLLMNDTEQAFYRANGWLVHTLFFLSVVSFVLMLMKKTKGACFLQIAVNCLVVLQVIQIFSGSYHNQGLLATFYLLILVTLVASCIMLLIYRYEHKQLEDAVTKEYNRIYQEYPLEDGEMLTPEKLEEILLNREQSVHGQV
jgi:hypothetical protein